MRWAQEAAGVIFTTFRLLFDREDPCYLSRLPADVLIDNIFPLLLVEDIIRIRQTNKALYLLTHEAAIWRRFLQRMHGIPLAQMRPTFDVSAATADHEIEPLVTGACAMERAWRLGFPHIRSQRILTGQRLKVVDLKMVPGGKFLVASVRDRVHARFFIEVYALDVMHGCRLLARLPTFHKVYDLQAKYMAHKGLPGIMISYTRRRFKNGAMHDVNVNLAELSHKHPVDTVFPLEYDACVVHMRLDAVERLIKPTVAPLSTLEYSEAVRRGEAPFRDVLRIKTDWEVHAPALFETATGHACLGFIEDPGRIRLVMLATGYEATLEFTDYPGHDELPHRVRAFRYLPCQNGLLVVRTIADAPGPDALTYVVFEFYDFPDQTGPHVLTALGGWKCADVWHLDGEFTISDPEVPGKKTHPDHPDLLPKEVCPPTLWVFAPSSDPKGLAYWWFRPEPKPRERDSDPTEYHYTEVHDSAHFHRNRDFHERALPGTERTLLVELDAAGRTEAMPLNRLRRFHWPAERFGARYPHPLLGVCAPVTAPVEEDCVLAFTNIGCSENLGQEVSAAGGLTALAWDEGSGRICLAADGTDHIRVCDLAPVVEPHLRLAFKWRAKLLEPTPGMFECVSPHSSHSSHWTSPFIRTYQ